MFTSLYCWVYTISHFVFCICLRYFNTQRATHPASNHLPLLIWHSSHDVHHCLLSQSAWYTPCSYSELVTVWFSTLSVVLRCKRCSMSLVAHVTWAVSWRLPWLFNCSISNWYSECIIDSGMLGYISLPAGITQIHGMVAKVWVFNVCKQNGETQHATTRKRPTAIWRSRQR